MDQRIINRIYHDLAKSVKSVYYEKEGDEISINEILNLIDDTKKYMDKDIINHIDLNGQTPLIRAVYANSEKLVYELIIRNADISIIDRFEKTVIDATLEIGSLKMFIWFKEKGLQNNWEQIENFYNWIEDANIDFLSYLIEECNIDVNIKNKKGQTFLMIASEKGYKNIVSYLIEKGADINIKDKNNWTALMYAVKHIYNNVVIDELLKYNPDINIYFEKDTKYLLKYAIQNNNIKTLKLLSKKGIDFNMYNIKSYFEFDDGRRPREEYYYIYDVNSALCNSFEVEFENDCIPLIYAAKHNNLKLTKYFIRKKIDVNKKDRRGYTALMYAVLNQNFDIINLLYDKGADFYIENENNNSAYDLVWIHNKYPFAFHKEEIEIREMNSKVLNRMIKLKQLKSKIK